MSNRVQEDEKMRKVGDIRPGPRVGIDRVPPNMFRRAPPPIPGVLLLPSPSPN